MLAKIQVFETFLIVIHAEGNNQLFTTSSFLKYVMPHHSKLGSNPVVIYQGYTQGIHFTLSTW